MAQTNAQQVEATSVNVTPDSDKLASNSSSTPMDIDDQSLLKTPTRDSFALETASQPAATLPENGPISNDNHSLMNQPSTPKNRVDSVVRTGSVRSARSVESGGTVGEEEDDDDDGEGSDNESVTSEAGRPSKKKRGQRFFCTDFPPCQLSFTRSEHLARHIRKHTGERPFQCHCLRRFSRLDNLRQHAQTVHVNEEIPGDSLAATGTRFQRQIRTDRMRPAGNRSRASTVGSNGSQGRGHSRNYSGSSIGSVSDFGSPDDARRRHPPLSIAQTPTRTGLGIDTYSANASPHDPHYYYYTQSPTAYGSTNPGFLSGESSSSPAMPPPLQSPISMTPRALTWGERTPTRRLSVPSGPGPFQPSPYNPSMPGMSPLASSNASLFSSNANSTAQSPTSSHFLDGRRESTTEADIRRRTWHPGTYPYGPRPATSGLSYYQTPDAPQPVSSTQPAAAQSVRLPGIDSFDRGVQNGPPRRALSPMEVDPPSRRSSISNTISFNSDNRQTEQRESLQHQQQADQRNSQPIQYPPPQLSAAPAPAPAHPVIKLSDPPTTPRHRKRQGWYNGPLPGGVQEGGGNYQATRTSPGGSSSSEGLPTPSAGSVAESHPTIIHSNGVIESAAPDIPMEDDRSKPPSVAQRPNRLPQYTGPPSDQNVIRSSGGMDRFDALVAAATSESQAVGNR